jgi:hypothetical protein
MSTPNICVLNPTTHLIDFVSGVAVSTGISGAGAPVVLNALGQIDSSLIGAGTTVTVAAGTNLKAGQLVNLYGVAGVLTAQPATAATGLSGPGPGPFPAPAGAFVNATVTSGQSVTVYFAGTFQYVDTNSEFSASSVGVPVYLRADLVSASGSLTLTPPSGIGQLVQVVGYVISYNPTGNIVTANYLAGFENFSQISGIVQTSQGGTGASTAGTNLFFGGPAVGPNAPPTFRALTGADLPTPTYSVIGGVTAVVPTTHQWVNSISTTGVPTTSQPGFTDISGVLSSTQLPAFTGDAIVTGGTSVTTVVAIQGIPVQSGTPTAGNVLTYASGEWRAVAPTTGTTITLETDGTPNITQNVLNLIAGTNVGISSDSLGNVTISSTGGGGGGGTSVTQVTVPFSSTVTFTASSALCAFNLTLTGNVTSSALAAGAFNPAFFIFQVAQDSVGSRTFTWPTNFFGVGLLNPTPNQTFTQYFYFDGTNAWAVAPAVVYP